MEKGSDEEGKGPLHFSRTELSHNAERLFLTYLEINSVYSLNNPVVSVKIGLQIFDSKEQVAVHVVPECLLVHGVKRSEARGQIV